MGIDVRVIAATNQNLEKIVKEKKFREDLYYRINVIEIKMPPLREKKEDIPLLVDHFIRRFNLKMNKRIASVSPEVMDLFMRYDFPGNIRQLENAIEHAFVLCQGTQIRIGHLPPEFLKRERESEAPGFSLLDPLKTAERQIIQEALEKHKGSRKRAAVELGVSPVTLWRKMRNLGLPFPRARASSEMAKSN